MADIDRDLSPLTDPLKLPVRVLGYSALVSPVQELPLSLLGRRETTILSFAANAASPQVLFNFRGRDTLLHYLHLNVTGGTTAPSVLALSIRNQDASVSVAISPDVSPGLSSTTTLVEWFGTNSAPIPAPLIVPAGFQLVVFFTAGTADVTVALRPIGFSVPAGLVYPRLDDD